MTAPNITTHYFNRKFRGSYLQTPNYSKEDCAIHIPNLHRMECNDYCIILSLAPVVIIVHNLWFLYTDGHYTLKVRIISKSAKYAMIRYFTSTSRISVNVQQGLRGNDNSPPILFQFPMKEASYPFLFRRLYFYKKLYIFLHLNIYKRKAYISA